MNGKILKSTVRVVTVLVLAFGTSALAQGGPVRLSGIINDYTASKVTPTSPTTGPWEVRGVWSLTVDGDFAKADFSGALTMERSDKGVTQTGGDFDHPTSSRHAHTHHITLVDGAVTPLDNGFRVTGEAQITGNGNFPPDFGGSSSLQIDVTGGNTVTFSNIAVTFIGDAASHFGSDPIHGVVRRAKKEHESEDQQ